MRHLSWSSLPVLLVVAACGGPEVASVPPVAPVFKPVPEEGFHQEEEDTKSTPAAATDAKGDEGGDAEDKPSAEEPKVDPAPAPAPTKPGATPAKPGAAAPAKPGAAPVPPAKPPLAKPPLAKPPVAKPAAPPPPAAPKK
jgi:hypothetical protein